jgi:hypothetical protein
MFDDVHVGRRVGGMRKGEADKSIKNKQSADANHNDDEDVEMSDMEEESVD